MSIRLGLGPDSPSGKKVWEITCETHGFPSEEEERRILYLVLNDDIFGRLIDAENDVIEITWEEKRFCGVTRYGE